jgi:hypothetical protein
MSNGDTKLVWINGYRWRNVTHETTAGPRYALCRVEEIGGDPRRLHEIAACSDSG